MPLDFPANPANGDVYGQYVYDSSITSWRSQGSANNLATQISALQTANATYNMSGLVPIVPTSVAVGSGTGSVNSAGVVTFSGVSSLSINNVFTGAYKNYRIVINIDTAGGQTSIGQQLTSAGTAATAANYFWAGWWGSVTGNGPGLLAAQSQSYWYMIEATNSVSWFNHVQDIFNPALAKDTSMTGSGGTYSSAWRAIGYNCFHQSATAYDGMKFTSSTANTFSGTIQVYGYR